MKIKHYIQLSIVSALLTTPLPLLAGTLNSPATPNDAMCTLDDIWDRLKGNTTDIPASSTFKEPTSGPGSTMHTLTEICTELDTVMDAIPSCIPNSSASPFFTDNGDGTVTDNRTCLMWLKDADCVGTQAWANVDTSAEVVALINAATCDGYTANTYTDWRLPSLSELVGLTDASSNFLVMPSTPFSGVQMSRYWSSSSFAVNTTNAWYVDLAGFMNMLSKTSTSYIWPVRGGQFVLVP